MRLILFLFLASLMEPLWGQSILSSAGYTWRKVSVDRDAVYKIDYNQLKSMGFNPDGVDPRKIQLFTGWNGMLLQKNSTQSNDLAEVAIFIEGESDGKFNSGDYILFFGKGPDSYSLDPAKGVFSYVNNFFTDKNYYFLGIGPANGYRIAASQTISGTFPIVAEYDDFGYYETDQSNELRSGRTWYGERFESTLEYTIRFDQSNIVDGSTIKLATGVMGRSYSPSSFQFSVNNIPVKDQSVPPVINGQYEIVGAEVHDTITVNANTVGAPGKASQDVKIKFTKATSGQSIGFLDYILLQTRRALSLYGDQTVFTSLKSLEQSFTRFQVSNTFSDGMIWNITDANNPTNEPFIFSSGVSSFLDQSDALATYIVLSNRNFPVPVDEGLVPFQDVRGVGPTDLLIITAPEFLSEAERLASHRRTKNGLKVNVVTTVQVYNEFSGGKQDVTALRNLVKYLYDNSSGISNVLLFGKGSYDYKNHLTYNKNFVPIYQSRNSLNPLATYSSDDYIGFLENSEGNWGENPPETHTLDVGVGRIPVKKIEEAAAWVDKVISYENQNWGSWRKKVLFVADDGDNNTHQSQANQLATTLETDNPNADVSKTYLDFYEQKNSSSGQVSPDARKALSRGVSDGVGVLNFTGHGSELQWMQERILDQVSFDEWKPVNRYPFLVTATCEFGRNDDPGLISSAELSLFKSKSGSIGLLTTSRPVYSSSNFTLNKAFYEYLFTRDNGLYRDWGTVFRDTKNNSISGVSNRNFSLLGDPSMMPPIGSTELQIGSITNLTSGSDTLKGLSKVRITGSVVTQTIPDIDFDGRLSITLYDKPVSRTTRGDENSAFNFKTIDNALFRGQGDIQSGAFDIEFIIPKSIDQMVGLGKLSLYAYSKSGNRDAQGSDIGVKIGSMEENPGTDSQNPGIELFMGDTTFISGGLAGANSRIVAILEDENGIDISDFNPDNDIVATLDDSLSLHLNAYYTADVGTYKRGKVDYPLEGIKSGNHSLTMQGTDTFGNSTSTSITFFVSDQTGIQIEQWLNYPNPFAGSTTFHFKHNRSGEDLEAAVTIFDRLGKVVLSQTYQIGSSSYKVDLPPWDGTASDGTKLGEGLYLMKLAVRSLLDGTKNERIAKVILLN